jgi:hypothetical protein
MTAIAAKTKHCKKWKAIHEIGCRILSIDPDQNINGFITVAKYISDFTDARHHPPRTEDFRQLVI